MSNPLKQNSAFKTSGDKPDSIRSLEERMEDVLAHKTLLGLTGYGKT
ncbi:hypothetical protein ABFP36_24690, partial [Salmonella enterica subsp. enterica serovar Kentucky]